MNMTEPPGATWGDTKASLPRLSVLIGLGVFSTVFANHARLAKLPLRAIIKDDLGLSPEAMAAFFALAGLASYLKPLAGALSDHVPFLGTRRRHYLLLSAFGGAVIWAVTAALPPTYDYLLAAMIVLNIAIAVGNAAVGGLLVDSGRVHGAAGPLSALRVTVTSSASLLAGPVGGWLAGRAFGLTCAIGVALMLSLGACLFLFLHEAPATRAPPTDTPSADAGGRALIRAFRSRSYIATALVCVVFYAMPSFGTPLYYHQKNTLALSDQAIGWLVALNCFGGIVGALFYAAICRRLSLRVLLPVGIWTYAGCMLLYLAYDSWRSALALEAFTGFLCTLAILPLQHLVARVSPLCSGALGYALLLGLGNAAVALSDLLGTQLMARFEVGLSGLIWISGASAAATVFLVPLVPAAVLDEREGRSATLR